MAARPLSEEHRREPRQRTKRRASVRLALSIEILDASRRGVRARLPFPLPVGTTLRIGVPGGVERHARVAWAEGNLFGCEFMAPLSVPELATLLAATVQANG